MSAMHTKRVIAMTRLLLILMVAATLLAPGAYAAAPGISGTTFQLTAQASYISQPDGEMIYSWGYGCVAGFNATFNPPSSKMPGATCPTMQVPGPTLIVTEGQLVTVTLTNNLPAAAGNTSILFPGFQVTATGGVAGLLTGPVGDAAPGGSVSYSFTPGSPGTRAYYSGTQSDLQVEMGLYGAIIVLPAHAPTCANANLAAESANGEVDYRLTPNGAAFDHAASCYDREYLFQFSEIDPLIHTQAEQQLAAIRSCVSTVARPCPTTLDVHTEPYHPAYFMINGRSMPDDMDTNYASQYPHQPYNGNPHMHPGELVLLRVIGQGRWQHPFHEHGNHVRILARDGNLILSSTDAQKLAGPLLFTTTTTPGLAMDGIFYWTGKGLNWDIYGHNPSSSDPLAKLPCTPDANGYNTGAPAALNYYEWCADHNKALEKAPFGDVNAGGPATLPDANILTNGAWYGGSAYLGPNATTRATGPTGTTPPSGTIANPPGSEAGLAFMWHSHNEREITTNNIFPGGMMMMMLVDSREFPINESF
jgi:FtsP/CotA-like multicopper oxidase with cupredoxin domain